MVLECYFDLAIPGSFHNVDILRSHPDSMFCFPKIEGNFLFFPQALVNEVENFEKVIDGLEEQRLNTLADEVRSLFFGFAFASHWQKSTAIIAHLWRQLLCCFINQKDS